MTSALLDSWLEWLQLVRGRVLSRLDRPPRPVSEHGFDLDFADRKAVRSLFEEGTGPSPVDLTLTLALAPTLTLTPTRTLPLPLTRWASTPPCGSR